MADVRTPEQKAARAKRERERRASDPAYAAVCSERTRRSMAKSGPDFVSVKNRAARLRSFGLTLESFAALAAQGCHICGTQSAGGRNGQFHVDHDHITGKTRGVLCHGCNIGLGHFRDDPNRLMAAASYLISHEDVPCFQTSA